MTERYELFRDYLKHEDTLVSHRFGWGLTIQSFIFAALGVTLKTGPNDIVQIAPSGPLLVGFLANWGIPIFGILIGLSSTAGIYAAHRAIRHITAAYASQESIDRNLPGLTDGGSSPVVPFGTIASLGPSVLICALWSVILVILHPLTNAFVVVIAGLLVAGWITCGFTMMWSLTRVGAPRASRARPRDTGADEAHRDQSAMPG